MCYKVDCFRGIPGENDFVCGPSVNKFSDFFSCQFVFYCRLLSELVYAPMDIRIIIHIIIRDCINDRNWFLGGRGVIKVDKTLVPSQDSLQNWKVLSNPQHIKHLVPLPTHAFHLGTLFYRHINRQLYKVTTVFAFRGHFVISPEAGSSQLSLSNY